MGARRVYPEFEEMSAGEFAALLEMSKLAPEEKMMATQYVVWGMNYIDVGAATGYDRRTVARRMENRILPELRRMAEKNRENYVSA